MKHISTWLVGIFACFVLVAFVKSVRLSGARHEAVSTAQTAAVTARRAAGNSNVGKVILLVFGAFFAYTIVTEFVGKKKA